MTNKEIVTHYHSLQIRATQRIKAISKIKELKQEKQSQKKIRNYLDENFSGIINDKHLQMILN